MIQANDHISTTIGPSEYDYRMPMYAKSEKVIFDLLPFTGFDDNITYLKLPQSNAVCETNEESLQEQKKNIIQKFNIEFSMKNDINSSEISDECIINEDSDFYQNFGNINNPKNFLSQKIISSNPTRNDDRNTENLILSEKKNSSNNNSNYNSEDDEISPLMCKKTKIHLSEKALTFKESFYQIFTIKKKFQKKFVVQIHNSICRQIGLRRVNREESRSIDKYFQHFCSYSDKIIKCIQAVPISVWSNLIPSLFKFRNKSSKLEE